MKIRVGTNHASAFFNSGSRPLRATSEVAPSQIGSTFDPASDTFETLSDLQALVDAATTGDTLDLSDRGFRADQYYDVSTGNGYVDVGAKNLTFEGGYFSGVAPLTWSETSPSSGIYEADLDATLCSDYLETEVTNWLVDPHASASPQFHVFPELPITYEPEFSLCPDSSFDALARSYVSGKSAVTVHTTNGDNSPSGDITGFTIGNTYGWYDDWRDYLTSAGNRSVLYVGSPNLPYSNAISSVVDSPIAKTIRVNFSQNGPRFSNSFRRFCFHGTGTGVALAAGEYHIDPIGHKIYYRPVGTAPDDRVGIPSQGIIMRSASADSIALRDCTIVGGNGDAVNPGAVLSTGSEVTLTRSVVDRVYSGIFGGSVNISDCKFTNAAKRFVSASGTIDRCMFYNSVASSAILMQGEPSDGPYIIRRSLFRMPRSVHGQAVSLYQNSYQNAIIEGNVFHNCRQALTYQDNSNSGQWVFDAGLIVFGNLFFTNKTYLDGNIVEPNFNGFQVNAQTNGHVVGSIPVEMRYNTVLVDWSEIPYTDDRYRFAMVNLTDSTSNISLTSESNIFGAMVLLNLGEDDSREEFSNAYMLPQDRVQSGSGILIGENQYALFYNGGSENSEHEDFLSTYGTHYNTTTLQVASGSAISTAAADGAAIGHRFRRMPTLTELESMDYDWSYTFDPMLSGDRDVVESTTYENTESAAEYYDSNNPPNLLQ